RIAEPFDALGVDDGYAGGRLQFLFRSARGGDDDLVGVDRCDGHDDPPVDDLPSQRDAPPFSGTWPTLHGWTRPEKRTTNQGRFLTSPMDNRLTVAGTAPDFRRLPF